jgi:hypothetical protein
MVTVLQTQNIFDIVGYRIPLCYRGSISNSNEFPSRLLAREGMVLTMAADVSDINPEKTNTGKSFVQGQTVIWNNGDWWELPECSMRPDYYHWTATYSCSTLAWTVASSGVDKTGPVSAWSGSDLIYTCTTLSATTPDDPLITPVCPAVVYYFWAAEYCCSIGVWNVYLAFEGPDGPVTDGWQISFEDADCHFYYQVNTSPVMPVQPPTPVC